MKPRTHRTPVIEPGRLILDVWAPPAAGTAAVSSVTTTIKHTVRTSRGKQWKRFIAVLVVVTLCGGLLFYSGEILKDVQRLPFSKKAVAPSEVVSPTKRPEPVAVEGLTAGHCARQTILQIVAHPDDDLLFMNPDASNALARGTCVRTIYLTSGDNGGNVGYAADRETGLQAAYDVMTGHTTGWSLHSSQLTDSIAVKTATMNDSDLVELYFIRLPDGGVHAEGYAKTSHATIERISADHQKLVSTIDGTATYTYPQLLVVLEKFIAAYQPIEIHSLGDAADKRSGDHPDHIAAGQLANAALTGYRQNYRDTTAMPLKLYEGYPVAQEAVNLMPDEQQRKGAAFFAYAQADHNSCKDMAGCDKVGSNYGRYIERQYSVTTRH